MLLMLSILLALILIYVLVLRALLHKIPAFAKFYGEADGFWSHVWAICGKSLTMLWSYVLGGIGGLFALLDRLGPVIGDPSLDLESKIRANLTPTVAGYVLLGISLITIAVRVRSLGKSS